MGPPAFGARQKLLLLRPGVETEGEARGFLDREVARRKNVRVAEREQQIDFGRPAPDALDRAQSVDRLFRLQMFEVFEVEPGVQRQSRLADRAHFLAR